MTYESFYKDRLDKAISTYETSYRKPLDQFRNIPPRPQDLVSLLTYGTSLKNTITKLEGTFIQPLQFDVLDGVSQHFNDLQSAEDARVDKLNKRAEALKENARLEYEHERADVAAYNANLTKPFEEKHKQLLDMKDQLIPIFKHYSITPLDVALSENMTPDEFGILIDSCLETCDKYHIKTNSKFDDIIQWFQKQEELPFVISIFIIVFVLTYFALPVLAIPAFVLLFMSVHNMYKDMEKLRIAYSLMSTVDYNVLIADSERKVFDKQLDYSSIEDELKESIGEVKDYSQERDNAISSLNENALDVSRQCAKVTAQIKAEYAEVINKYKKEYEEVTALTRKLLSEQKRFPTVQQDRLVMNRNFVLGQIENAIDVPIEIPSKNLVFDSTDRSAGINKMKLYLANALLSVRVKQLTVEIYDPKNMCGEFVEFFVPETKEYIKPNKMSLSDLIKTYREYSQTNILELNNKHIDEFNADAEKRELVPKAYKLLLIISEFKDLGEDSEQGRLFKEYMAFSISSGVWIWLLDSNKWADTLFIDNSYNAKGAPLQYTPALGTAAINTYTKALANYKDTGIDYISKFGDVFIPRDKWWTYDTIADVRMPFGLENGDPTRGLNVAPRLNDGNVHALLGGATGAGKSAAINQLLISLITMYPPSELQLIYIDFKNVEAAKFTRGYDVEKNQWLTPEVEEKLRKDATYYTRLSNIPHLKIISGTTDGEYALSVFEYLMSEMARRQELINKAGVTKLQTLRENILNEYNRMKGTPNGTWKDMRADWDWYKPNVEDVYGDLSRLLVIFDEFQVMYNPEFVDNRIIDMINGKITAFTKLARAMSGHLWFTSQSMKGTMSKDTMANFSVRGALRCTSDVSEELLGNKAASTIKSKFGFMYTNDSAGQDPEANRLWRVPFLADSHKPDDNRELRDMFDYVTAVNKMLGNNHETSRMAEFYDEKLLVPASELSKWYTKYPEVFKKPSVFIAGERAAYSTNKAPVTISLQQDGGENVMIAAFDRSDMLNILMTFINNIKLSEDCTLIMNVQDKETHTVIDVENLVDEAFLPLSYPNQDIPEFIDAIDTLVEKRIAGVGPYKPIFVVCVQWERAPGISVDINYKLGDKLKDVMRKAPGVGVHFIMASREKLDMQRFIPNACNHKVVGLLPKDSAFFCENSTKAEKLPDSSKDVGLFALYEFGKQLTKFRIYQTTFTKQIESRDIVL